MTQKSQISELGNIVRKHRAWVGKSQRAVAREVGLHHGFIARIELGEKNFSVDTLAKLGKALGIGFLMEYMSAIINEQVESDYQDKLRNRPEVVPSKPVDQGRPLDQARDAESDGGPGIYYIYTNGVRTAIKLPVPTRAGLYVPYNE